MELDPLRVNDDLSLAPGTQLAITDGDQYIIVNLQYEDASGGSGPSGIVFHKPQLPHTSLFEKDTTKVEFSEEGIPVIECAAVNADDGQQASLDHEQALAVANLLNFHNQQSSQLYAMSSAGGTITKDTVTISSSDLSAVQRNSPSVAAFESDFIPEVHDDMSSINNFPAGDSPQVSDVKRPVKTYSRKKVEKPLEFLQTGPAVSISAPTPKTQLLPVKSRVILPSSTVSLDSLNRKQRRRCFNDIVRVIPPGEFKMQLMDTSDIVSKKVDVAPSSKKEMHHLAYSGVGKYFSHPGRKIGSVPLSKMFFSRLTMTTEPKPVANSESKLEPLDADLRTPGTRDLDGISVATSESLPTQPGPVFTEAIARKTASSFESYCKGMPKQPRFDHLRKRHKLNQSPVDESTDLAAWKKSKESSAKTVSIVYNAGNGCEIADIRVHSDSVSLDDSSTLYSEDGFIDYDNSRVLVKSENPEGEGTVTEDTNQNQELDESATANPSSIDMLIAAAERENNVPPSTDRASTPFELCTDGVVEVKEEDGATTEIYSANDGNLIFVWKNEQLTSSFIEGRGKYQFRAGTYNVKLVEIVPGSISLFSKFRMVVKSPLLKLAVDPIRNRTR